MHESIRSFGRLCDHAFRSRRQKTFKQVNIHKAAGPDRLPGRVPRACADQLAGVFTDIFIDISLIESVIPTCFKQTTIVHVHKNTKVTCLNDYRPVALTSVVMKCFERLVMAHINTIIPETLDPLQFAYLPNISTGDSLYFTPHCPFTPEQKEHLCENAQRSTP